MIPSVQDLQSSPLPVRFGDHFNLPGLTNFLGSVQADLDLTGVRNLNFPPLFTSNTASARLFLDGEHFVGTGTTITYRWRPDRILRTAEHDGLELTCETTLAVGAPAVVQRLRVRNVSGVERDVSVRLRVEGWVTRFVGTITDAEPPCATNDAHVDTDRGAMVFVDPDTSATSVQGLGPGVADLQPGWLAADTRLGAGETWQVGYVNALGDDAASARALYDTLARDIDAVFEAAESDWNAELAAVVTPGNDRYSGHLPRLETSDEDLLRLYWMGILGVTYFKRDTPHSVVGRTYDTLMPRYWPTVTFLWDYSLSSVVHALLDPAVMRTHQAHWMATDVHTCMGTEWLTGKGLGAWYAVNDYAMTRMLFDYLRWTGDRAWFTEPVETPTGSVTPLEKIVDYARSWQEFETPHGLADYGGIGNLLECVSTYVHEVASLNAANVFCLRRAADLVELQGDAATARTLRKEAEELVARVDELYVEGEGYWNARFPDGSHVPVRHCYDLATVLYAMPDDLSDRQRAEMVGFFENELKTDRWMRALSNRDPDAVFSVRADHQWNGAYCAWPSEVAAGLYAVGEGDRASQWVRGLARSANQGPFGQAHFAEQVIEPHAGGARKVPADVPYINDWACSSGGSWVRLVIEGVFGVDAGLEGLRAAPQLDGFDADARLVGLHHQGQDHEVTATGVRTAS
ncbi:MAG: hypothetical protein R3320_13115 [Nitriliruptorales bacterium]|nr:hypothetical protein [Nitriliruptorales bacterium]